MKIIKLSDRRKGLTALILEDNSELLLDSEIVILNNLQPGVILDDPDALVFESDLKRAKSRALWYLSRGDLAEKKLREKLLQGGFMPEATDAAVKRMTELGLINDERLAERLYEYLSESGASKREILHKLQNKGIHFDIAREIVENDDSDESEKLIKLIKTKYAGKLDTEEGVRKTFNTLIRHGYSYSDVRDALKAYSEEIENSEDY